MEKLPNEVIVHIFQHIPQRYRAELSIVCRKWYYILTQALFFNTLNIYTIRQLKKYIEMGKEKPINNDIPFGHLVKHLYFHTEHHVCTKYVRAIVNTFPNLHSIQGSFKTALKPRSYINRLNQIEHISFWYQSKNNHWMDIISEHPDQLKSLEFTITPNLLASNIIEQEQQASSSSSSSSSSATFSSSYSPSPSSLLLQSFNSPHSSVSSLSHPLSSPSPTPNIYFTPITPYKLRPSEFEPSEFTRYEIYTITLPMLSYLTHLNIDCKNYDCDEHMFESIHQSCPQLFSLTLKLINMNVSDDYDKRKPLLQPNLQLKELNIHHKIYDHRCYDYLSIKYPNLISLHLNIYRLSYAKTEYPSYRLSIYNMVTQYIHLKKLSVKSVSKIFNSKGWPHAELLYWLKENPAQLTHLDYEYIFVDSHLNQRQDPSPNTRFNDDIFYQSHDYLKHLTSLSLGSEPYVSVYTLYYFYLCLKDSTSTILSNSLEELKIDTIKFGNIFFWLDAFPNLKSFIIYGHGEVTTINDDDIGDDRFYKEKYQFLKKKMNWKEQNDIDSTETTKVMNHLPYRYYKLKKVKMVRCNVDFKKYGWNGFFKHFNELKAITLIQVNRIYRTDVENQLIEPPLQATLDLSHLSLDLIEIEYFNYEQYKMEAYKNHYVRELVIKETLLNKTYYVGYENEYSDTPFNYENSTTLNIKSKCINNISFYQYPPRHYCECG